MNLKKSFIKINIEKCNTLCEKRTILLISNRNTTMTRKITTNITTNPTLAGGFGGIEYLRV